MIKKTKESKKEMHDADAKQRKKLRVVAKTEKKRKLTKLKTERPSNNNKVDSPQKTREESIGKLLDDSDDINLARDVVCRTSTYVNSLSKAEQQEFESLRKWAQGYDVSLHKNNSSSKHCDTINNNCKKRKRESEATTPCVNASKRAKRMPLCKQREELEEREYENVNHARMNKSKQMKEESQSNDFDKVFEESWENSISSVSSSEPSWLSESDDDIENDIDQVEEKDDDDEEGTESDSDVATRTNVAKGGIFRSNDDIWND